MRTHTLIFLLGLLPLGAMAQAPAQVLDPSRSTARDAEVVNATTLAVLRANCPKGMAEAEWLKLMEIPANRAAFPLRITQGMLDTLDGREMDLRFQYLFIPDQTQHHGPRVR
ncbi:MAG: hypothetical protein ABIY71_07475 [Flavobacteriales bacterium]